MYPEWTPLLGAAPRLKPRAGVDLGSDTWSCLHQGLSPVQSRSRTLKAQRFWPAVGDWEPQKVLEPWSDALSLFQLQPEQLDCGAAHLQHPLSVLQPLKALPVFRAPGLSSVAVAGVGNYTVVFLGTVSGRLLKVWLGRGWLAGAGRGPTG